jgi:hypothetical protein
MRFENIYRIQKAFLLPNEFSLLCVATAEQKSNPHDTSASGRNVNMNAYVTRHWKSGFLQRKHGREMLAGLFILVSSMLFLAPVASLAASATVFVEGVPGGVIVNTVEVNAKVID